ncbi:hypothetical protein GCM10029992_48960 [Glycomyces albus]
MFAGMIAAAAKTGDRPPLRYAVSGGAALPAATLEGFEAAFGAEVHEGYGLTETSPTCTFNSVYEPIRPGTVGRPIWGVEVAVAEAETEGRIALIAEPGKLGEVVVRGHNLMKGYLGNPEATEAAVVDGWFRTGDLGTMDAEGTLTIVDRKKDMIIRNGYNVYPTEVEAVLARFPGVSMAAVFGVPHDVHGQEIHAAVLPAEGVSLDAAAIVAHMKEKVAAYKYPRAVHVVDELPIGPSGKVVKRRLAEQFT